MDSNPLHAEHLGRTQIDENPETADQNHQTADQNCQTADKNPQTKTCIRKIRSPYRWEKTGGGFTDTRQWRQTNWESHERNLLRDPKDKMWPLTTG